MDLWSGTDLCYNLHGGLLIEAGNGIDDSQLLLKLLGQQAHVLEDTGNILLAGVKFVEQTSQQTLFRIREISAAVCGNFLQHRLLLRTRYSAEYPATFSRRHTGCPS